TLLELVVVLLVAAIVFAAASGSYYQVLRVDRRQQKVVALEQEILSIQQSLDEPLTTQVGRDYGYYADNEYGIPKLPANGAIQTERETTPIQMYPATPFRVNGHDAITLMVNERKKAANEMPRLMLVEPSTDLGVEGIARVVSPDLSTTVPPGGGKGGGGGIGKVDDDNGGKGGGPPGGGKGGGGITIPPGLFNIGDLFLLVGTQALRGRGAVIGPLPIDSRLVRLTAMPSIVTLSNPTRVVIELRYNLCETGNCGAQLPYMTNTTTTKQFAAGSTLIPINLVHFHIVEQGNRKLLMRNVGGSIIPDSSSGQLQFRMVGGTESVIGEVDDFSISYLLADGRDLPTPETPLVDWLNQVNAVRIKLSKSAYAESTRETIKRDATLTYPFGIRAIQ
ncbi:MAG: hypothetical protein AB1489_38085, partial [Acidobacteriota bacterium]